MKTWKRAIKLREDLEKTSLEARNEGEHDLSDALKRAARELRHPSFTQGEDKGK